MSNSFIPLILNSMIRYFGNDSRLINHTLKVYGFAVALSGGLNENARDILLLSAILHDIGIKNAELLHNSSSGEFQELEGPPVARTILEEESIPAKIIERVCFLVGHHHSYSKIDNEDFQCLIEADFLVNINEGVLAREAILLIKNKYFRTSTGLKLIFNIYGV